MEKNTITEHYNIKIIIQDVTITIPQNFGHQDLISDGAGMLGNGPDDTVFKGFPGAGCCTLSDRGHSAILWNKEGGHPIIITGKETIIDYQANCPGYDPNTGSKR